MTHTNKGKVRDIAGQRFGKLIAIRYERERVKNGTKIWWHCKCDCGLEKKVITSNLVRGDTLSCGCATKAMQKVSKTTHGRSKTSNMYAVWNGMMARCYNSSANGYNYYGGKGIRVCDRWHSFSNFESDMRSRAEGYTLDRIDSSCDYSKDNCRWVTTREQARNREGVKLDHNDVSIIKTILKYAKLSHSDIAVKFGVSKYAIRHISRGSRWEDVSSIPV